MTKITAAADFDEVIKKGYVIVEKSGGIIP